MEKVIEVAGLTKTYVQKPVLKQLNFSVDRGEIVALLGKNGAGKSTLLNILLQMIPKDSGKVEILGSKQLKTEKIGVMLQNDFSLERVTVKEVIKLWQSYYPNSKDYAELLQIADLADKQNQFLTKLSGGQRRRLSFALCLAGDPELIFLDEPTVGMDVVSRQKFWQQIKNLQALGKTFLITSHYLEELQGIAQRFLILKDGMLAFDGTLQQLQQGHQVVTLSFDSQLDQSLFVELPGILAVKADAGSYTLKTTQLNECLPRLMPYLPAIENLNIEQGSLNELFFELTGGRADDKAGQI
ncbi:MULTISPECIES: ABC transporter ATP-binding protein [Ligilactobacillus]|uniref:ABC transporter ATP-binding protein n=1 Tax=Ligilactobacillus TaxID=2767887 RepID=UPI00259A3A5E|nr:MULTISPECIES: ABC transporter ATP-binding protein [Ligilactobacillus]WOY88619.1 ABC transporter ATP-binding protein [Ligilactobacillus murinus]